MLLRKNRTMLGIALTSLAAVMLTVPATAFADHGDRRTRSDHRGDDDRHRDHARDSDRGDHDHYRKQDRRNHYRNRSFAVAKRGHGVVRRSHHRHYRHPSNGYPPPHSAAYKKHKSPYYCKPCNHRFSSRSGFHGHLSGHHHVPPWRLPAVIVHHTLGWVFFG